MYITYKAHVLTCYNIEDNWTFWLLNEVINEKQGDVSLLFIYVNKACIYNLADEALRHVTQVNFTINYHKHFISWLDILLQFYYQIINFKSLVKIS